VGVILLGTSLPGSALRGAHVVSDKVAHFALYAPLGALLVNALRATTSLRRRPLVATFMAVVIGVLFGALDEWHQLFIPGRDCTTGDWHADIKGIVTGAIAAIIYLSRKDWRPRHVRGEKHHRRGF
jgi:VanZ family protein